MSIYFLWLACALKTFMRNHEIWQWPWEYFRLRMNSIYSRVLSSLIAAHLVVTCHRIAGCASTCIRLTCPEQCHKTLPLSSLIRESLSAFSRSGSHSALWMTPESDTNTACVLRIPRHYHRPRLHLPSHFYVDQLSAFLFTSNTYVSCNSQPHVSEAFTWNRPLTNGLDLASYDRFRDYYYFFTLITFILWKIHYVRFRHWIWLRRPRQTWRKMNIAFLEWDKCGMETNNVQFTSVSVS